MISGEGAAQCRWRSSAWLREGSFADGPDDQPVDPELLVARHLTDGEQGDQLHDGRRMLAHYIRRPAAAGSGSRPTLPRSSAPRPIADTCTSRSRTADAAWTKQHRRASLN
jgi:hypothetical protein